MALKKGDLESMFQFNTMNMSDKVKTQILKPSGRGGVFAARDYIAANALLAEFNKQNPGFNFSQISDEKELWEKIDPATRFRLRMYTPCLCERYDSLKEKEQKELFDSTEWVASEKQNGCRGVLIVYNGQVHLFSRNYSDKDCGLLEYWNNIDQQVDALGAGIYAIDVEIKFEPGADIREDLESLGLTTDSPLEAMVALLHTYPEEAVKIQQKYKAMYGHDLIVFRLIHPLYFEGKNYLRRVLGEGIDVYDKCVEFGRKIGLNVKPIDRCAGSREEKEVFLNSIIARGGEGVVFWNRKGNYNTSENRSKTSWIKLKRTITDTEKGIGIGDSVDGFITGFKVGSNGTANEGMIAAINVSVYVSSNDGKIREHMIASIPNIEKSYKELMTINDASGLWPQEVMLSDGTTKWISMNPDFDHLVVECTGQALSSVSQRLEHPRMIMFRPERDPNSCVITQAWLDANTTNKGVSYKQHN